MTYCPPMIKKSFNCACINYVLMISSPIDHQEDMENMYNGFSVLREEYFAKNMSHEVKRSLRKITIELINGCKTYSETSRNSTFS